VYIGISSGLGCLSGCGSVLSFFVVSSAADDTASAEIFAGFFATAESKFVAIISSSVPNCPSFPALASINPLCVSAPAFGTACTRVNAVKSKINTYTVAFLSLPINLYLPNFYNFIVLLSFF
jgi:hypothetical protein